HGTWGAERGAEAVRADWNAAEREVAEEFIIHARAIRAERELAAREGRPPRLAQLIDSWGGVTIAYRRRLIDAPSYTLNHQEVAKAMEEGIRFADCLSPIEVEVDVFEQAPALKLERRAPAAVRGHQPAIDQVRRERGQGGGGRDARLSGGEPHAGEARARRSGTGGIEGAARRRIARPRPCGRAADPEDRRGRRQGADGGTRLSARTVLPAAEL